MHMVSAYSGKLPGRRTCHLCFPNIRRLPNTPPIIPAFSFRSIPSWLQSLRRRFVKLCVDFRRQQWVKLLYRSIPERNHRRFYSHLHTPTHKTHTDTTHTRTHTEHTHALYSHLRKHKSRKKANNSSKKTKDGIKGKYKYGTKLKEIERNRGTILEGDFRER